jgi:hypothetical protein
LVRHALRGGAIAIAVAAAIDPVITSQRNAKPVVSVIAGRAAGDSSLAVRVERALAGSFTVLSARFANASAAVLVGSALPSDAGTAADSASTVVAVTPDTTAAQIAIDGVDAPTNAPLDARVPVTVRAHTIGLRGRQVTIALASDGGTVDQSVVPIASDRQALTTSLTYVPSAGGATPLHVVAAVRGTDSARTDLVVDVRDTRWPILFFDPHPSWMSTFVRRAAERDRRILVSSRVVTSRGVSADVGQPSQLDDLAGVSRFDAIVVGAPDALTDADVRGLESFLRQRGGRVILLFDASPTGPIRQLLGSSDWIARSENPSVAIVSATGDSAQLRASELAWPRSMPAGASAVAWVRDSTSGRATIWRTAIGAGEVVVSGAFDAWRYRDASSSTFERYWRSLIAGEASGATPPVSVRIASPVLLPGERTNVIVTARDAALSVDRLVRTPSVPAQSTVTASVDVSGHRTNVSLWPGDAVGELRGSFRAPMTLGTYRLVATANGATGDAPFVVANQASAPTRSDGDLLRAWVAARGGQTIAAPQIGELPALLERSIRRSTHAELWHPMRSTWWLAAFIAALSTEWWLRRRRGFA